MLMNFYILMNLKNIRLFVNNIFKIIYYNQNIIFYIIRNMDNPLNKLETLVDINIKQSNRKKYPLIKSKNRNL